MYICNISNIFILSICTERSHFLSSAIYQPSENCLLSHRLYLMFPQSKWSNWAAWVENNRNAADMLTMATFGKNLLCNGEQPRGALAKELLLPLEQMHRLSFGKPWPSFLLLHLTPHPKPTNDTPSKAHKWTSPIYPKTIMFNMAFWDTIKQYSLLHKFDTN